MTVTLRRLFRTPLIRIARVDECRFFADLGCKAAYNLDGGASAVMTFNDEIYSRPSNGGRALGDALLIKELDGTGEGDA